MEEVGDGGDCMAHAREDRTVENHLPLNATVGTEEGRGVHRHLKAHVGRTRDAGGRAVGWTALDGEEHAGVGRVDISPSVLLDELVFESHQPSSRAGVRSAKGLGAFERNVGAFRPVVHVANVIREYDFGWCRHVVRP